MTPARYLVDTSALTRLSDRAVEDVLIPLVNAGVVGVAIVTELEIGYSGRSVDDYRRTRSRLIDALLPVAMPARAEPRAREVQAVLVERGQHRSAGIADLLIAATAEVEQLTILHYESDFDVIAGVTGQPMEWVVPRGSID